MGPIALSRGRVGFSGCLCNKRCQEPPQMNEMPKRLYLQGVNLLGLQSSRVLKPVLERCLWGADRTKSKASVQNDPVAAGSGTASGWLQSWVPGEPTWRPWATWAGAGTWPSAQGSGTNRRQGSHARKLPLSRSLAIQVSCPCCGHACPSHSLASRCDWQLSTFPCHPDLADLAGHAS